MSTSYIHGTGAGEQARLAALNALTNDEFVAFLELPGARSILEVGSGLGILTAAVAQRAPEAQVVGVEQSERQLARAPTSVANLRFLHADAHALPVPDASFDLVYCRYVLEHLAEPARALAEMARVLRPGGRVFVQENDISLSRCDPPAAEYEAVWTQFAALQVQLGGHPFIGRELYRLLRAAGFETVVLSLAPEVHWAGSPGFDHWVANLIGNIEGAAAALVARNLASREQLEAALAELRRLRADPHASAWFYWNRATARRA